jgi:DNA-binding XRE family transcriptional regulator
MVKMNNIKEILKKQERNVSFLKKKTSISRYSLDLIVKNKKSPTWQQILEIANVLNVRPKDIFFDLETNTNNSNSEG